MANKKEIKLNLGSGDDYLDGYTNIDVNKKIKADMYVDFIEIGLPFKNNMVDEVYCKNLFEHVPNPMNFLIEIKRVLKKDGRAVIITSNASYFIYHFPRKKAYHDSYNLNHPIKDQHYFMFQKGHLIAFTNRLKMKLKRLDYFISNKKQGIDRIFQRFAGIILGKKFGYSDFIWILEK